MNSEEGIDQLLKAEAKAAEIIKAARENREKKLREADEVSQKEIAAVEEKLKLELENDPETKDETFDTFSKNLDDETKKACDQIHDDYTKNKDAAIQLLLHHVTTVELEMSEAMKQAFLNKDKEDKEASTI
eukprot:TRINITY_DN185_c0_g1_i1.p1 TRINITY_DN185_c0_g1~~TRINITY_DN185_c0_g1_i1.p1  ORF type:complete len:131 (-),score=48.21 TRINITY_DN185_c0_g1_i1:514-906(-)